MRVKPFFISGLFAVALTFADITHAQQQPRAGFSPSTTCTQQHAFCDRNCQSSSYAEGGGRIKCAYTCQQLLTDCLATGWWFNPNNGQKYPRQRE